MIFFWGGRGITPKPPGGRREKNKTFGRQFFLKKILIFRLFMRKLGDKKLALTKIRNFG